MKFSYFFLTLLMITGCAALTSQEPAAPPRDLRADVERFLDTNDPKEEESILKNLKEEKISHEKVKLILKDTLSNRSGPAGYQLSETIKVNGKPYPFALYVPETVTADIPMIVVLHGMGGRGETTLRPWVERLEGKYMVVCPSYPMGAWWSKNAEDLVLSLIRKLRTQYAVDHNRVFVAGLSNGAIGAYLIGMFYPDYFAGIVPVAGSITPRYMHFLVNLKNTPTYLIQGRYDPIFPIKLSRRVHKILSDLKSPVIYREHEEKGTAHGGHFLPDSEVPGLVQWLNAQKRIPFPSVVRMTREANHMGRIYWARLTQGEKLAALQLPGPEQEPLNIRDGKIASLFATYKGNNQFETLGKNLREFDLYLSSEMVDFKQTVSISTQELLDRNNQLIPGEKRIGFHQRVEPDLEILLRGFKNLRDPYLLFDARIKVTTDKTVNLTSVR